MAQDALRSLIRPALLAGAAFLFWLLPLTASAETLEDLHLEAKRLEVERNRLDQEASDLRDWLQRFREREQKYGEDVQNHDIYFVEPTQLLAGVQIQGPKKVLVGGDGSRLLLRVNETQLEDIALQLALIESVGSKPSGDATRLSFLDFFSTYTQFMHQLKLENSELKEDPGSWYISSIRRQITAIQEVLEATTAAAEGVAEKLSRVQERRAAMMRGEVPQVSEPFTPVEIKLVAGSWRFGRSRNSGRSVDEFLCDIVLTTEYVEGKGYRLRSNHPNESYWDLDGNDIVFFNDQATPSTRFARVGINHYEGKFLLDPSADAVHYLKK